MADKSAGHGGDLEPPAGLPRLRIQKYSAAHGAPAFGPSLPCFFESRKRETEFDTRWHPPSLRSYGGQIAIA